MRQRIILRLVHVDALIVTDSRLVIRVENMVTTSSLEDLEVDLNGTMSNYLRLALLILLSSLLIFSLCRSYKRLRRTCMPFRSTSKSSKLLVVTMFSTLHVYM